MSRRDRMKKLSLAIAPTAIYAVYFVVRVWPRPQPLTGINLASWHLLPLEAARDHPWQSLLFLHSQPPLRNVLFIVFLSLAEWTGSRPETWASLLMIGVGWASCVVWFAVARRLLRSFWLATVLVLLLVTNPAFLLFQTKFSYTPLLMLETGVFALAALAYAQQPTTRRLLMLMGGCALLSYTWAGWHPAFAIVPAGLAFWHLGLRRGSFRAALRQACLGWVFFAALVTPWMLKNRLMFNEFGFSTWLGLNARNFTLGRPNALFAFAMEGLYGEDAENAARTYYTPSQWRRLQDVPAVTIFRKPLNGPMMAEINMNHYVVPALNRITIGQLLEGYREKPAAIWPLLAHNAFLLTLPAFYLPYSYNAGTRLYSLWVHTPYTRWHDRIYYGGWLIPHTRLDRWIGPFGLNLFAALWLPIALLAGLVRLRHIRSPRGLVWAQLLAIQLWLLLVVTGVDGSEGARMRWQVEPVFLLLLFQALREIGGWVARSISAMAGARRHARSLWRRLNAARHCRVNAPSGSPPLDENGMNSGFSTWMYDGPGTALAGLVKVISVSETRASATSGPFRGRHLRGNGAASFAAGRPTNVPGRPRRAGRQLAVLRPEAQRVRVPPLGFRSRRRAPTRP